MRSLVLISAVVLLASCSTTKASYTPVEAVADPCPVEGLSDVKLPPTHPITAPEERNAVYSAIIIVVGEERAKTILRYWESTLPTWGIIGWNRVTALHDWCVKRNAPPH